MAILNSRVPYVHQPLCPVWPYMLYRIYCHMCCDWEKQLETYWQFSLKTFLGLHHIIFPFNDWKFEKILKSNTLVHNFFQIFHISRQFSSIGGWEVRTPDSGLGSRGSIPHRTNIFFLSFCIIRYLELIGSILYAF